MVEMGNSTHFPWDCMMIIRVLFFIVVVVALGLIISIFNCLQSGRIQQELTGSSLERNVQLGGLSGRIEETNVPKRSFRQHSGIAVETEKGEFYEYTGALHIHTVFSDGGGTYSEIGEIADSLGLDFIMPCDHNYVKSLRDNKIQRVGNTLVVPGVEISPGKGFGHFLVLGDSVPPVPRGLASPDSALHAAYNQGNMVFFRPSLHPGQELLVSLGNRFKYGFRVVQSG